MSTCTLCDLQQQPNVFCNCNPTHCDTFLLTKLLLPWQQSRPKAPYHHRAAQLGWSYYDGMHPPQNILPVAVWFIHVAFSKLEMGNNVLLGEEWVSPCYPAICTVSVRLIVDSSSLTLADAEEACRSLNVFWDSLRPPGISHTLFLV